MVQLSGMGSQFVKAAMKAPFLEREEEHLLAVRWKENKDQAALHALTEAHMRLVISVAVKFRNYGLPLPDLVQEGHVGLLEAAARFDPDREVRFSTYATWWIRASIQDFVLRNWSIVRGGTSSAQKALFFNLRRLRARLSQSNEGTYAVFKAIADAVGVSPTDVAWMNLRLSSGDISLNAPLSPNGENETQERVDYIVDGQPRADELVEADMDATKRSAWLNVALKTLNPRELRIVQERRLKEEGVTLEVLGAQMGISKERVRQIEVRALQKLKTALVAQNADLETE